MAELGYQEGRNFAFEYIQTPDIEGYEKNYHELAARKVDVFLAVGNERAQMAEKEHALCISSIRSVPRHTRSSPRAGVGVRLSMILPSKSSVYVTRNLTYGLAGSQPDGRGAPLSSISQGGGKRRGIAIR
jgi:hypothetical protein